MALKQGDRMNYETLKRAFRNEDVALVESRCAKTGEYRALLCAVMYSDTEAEYTMVPLAQMVTGNPYEDYTDPTVDDLDNPPPVDLRPLLNEHVGVLGVDHADR